MRKNKGNFAKHLLFQNQLAPLTYEIGFLEMDLAQTVKCFLDWQKKIHRDDQLKIIQKNIPGPFEKTLKTLLPLTNVVCRRCLFIPTASKWTAYFDNGHRGTDASSVISFMTRELKCHGIKMNAIPDEDQEKLFPKKNHGALTLQMYGPSETHFLNYIRTIQLSNQGNRKARWEFYETGTPFVFEKNKQYQNRKVKERFTFELLKYYLEQLGIFAFDEKFYLSESDAVLIEKIGHAPAKMQEFQLYCSYLPQ